MSERVSWVEALNDGMWSAQGRSDGLPKGDGRTPTEAILDYERQMVTRSQELIQNLKNTKV